MASRPGLASVFCTLRDEVLEDGAHFHATGLPVVLRIVLQSRAEPVANLPSARLFSSGGGAWPARENPVVQGVLVNPEDQPNQRDLLVPEGLGGLQDQSRQPAQRA